MALSVFGCARQSSHGTAWRLGSRNLEKLDIALGLALSKILFARNGFSWDSFQSIPCHNGIIRTPFETLDDILSHPRDFIKFRKDDHSQRKPVDQEEDVKKKYLRDGERAVMLTRNDRNQEFLNLLMNEVLPMIEQGNLFKLKIYFLKSSTIDAVSLREIFTFYFKYPPNGSGFDIYRSGTYPFRLSDTENPLTALGAYLSQRPRITGQTYWGISFSTRDNPDGFVDPNCLSERDLLSKALFEGLKSRRNFNQVRVCSVLVADSSSFSPAATSIDLAEREETENDEDKTEHRSVARRCSPIIETSRTEAPERSTVARIELPHASKSDGPGDAIRESHAKVVRSSTAVHQALIRKATQDLVIGKRRDRRSDENDLEPRKFRLLGPPVALSQTRPTPFNDQIHRQKWSISIMKQRDEANRAVKIKPKNLLGDVKSSDLPETQLALFSKSWKQDKNGAPTNNSTSNDGLDSNAFGIAAAPWLELSQSMSVERGRVTSASVRVPNAHLLQAAPRKRRKNGRKMVDSAESSDIERSGGSEGSESRSDGNSAFETLATSEMRVAQLLLREKQSSVMVRKRSRPMIQSNDSDGTS